MIDRKELEELKEILLNHCYKMSILRHNAEEKKKKAILDSLIVSIINTGLTLQEVKECISDVEIDGEIIELKGERDVRVMGVIRGKDFRKRTKRGGF